MGDRPSAAAFAFARSFRVDSVSRPPRAPVGPTKRQPLRAFLLSTVSPTALALRLRRGPSEKEVSHG